MDFQIRITGAALADFEEILNYSCANFPATAERFGNAILNHVDLLRRFPYIGCVEMSLRTPEVIGHFRIDVETS